MAKNDSSGKAKHAAKSLPRRKSSRSNSRIHSPQLNRMATKIKSIKARQIYDSRGNPTVEVDLHTENGDLFRAAVPSGASTGIHEALELRDKDKAWRGKGVLKAVGHVNNTLAPAVIAKEFNVINQREIDGFMCALDGTENKSKFGANAILGISLAVCKAGAKAKKVPLYRHIADLAGLDELVLPVPAFNVINGGSHAGNALAMQEFMILPTGASSFSEAMKIGSEVYHHLRDVIKAQYGLEATCVGDEGGFAPNIENNKQGLELIKTAIEKAGYTGKVEIGMDVAASEFYKDSKYDLLWKTKQGGQAANFLTGDQLGDVYRSFIAEYPIVSIEDPFDQDDWEAWGKLTASTNIQIVGDDLTVTNPKRIATAVDKKSCNALLLKVNQIGTVSESIEAHKLAKASGWGTMISHRSGETEDTFIADLTVGLSTGQIKTGAPCRSERLAKYNQILRIEEELGSSAKYAASLDPNLMPNHGRRVTSQDSTASVSSTSSQRISGAKDSGHEYATTAAVTTSFSKYLSDVCAIVIHCPKHEKFALVPCNHHHGLWLPYVTLKQSEGWYAAIVNKLRQLLNVKIGTKSSTVFTPPELMHVMRIQLPEVLKYVTRVVFMTNLQSITALSPSATNSSALHTKPSELEAAHRGKSTGSLEREAAHRLGNFRCYCEQREPHNGMRWFKHDTIVTEDEHLEIWGPEPGIFTSAFATNSVEKGAYSEYTLREAIRFQPRDQPRTYQEEMLKSCHFERGDILRLYSDYVQHCYPSQNMNYVSFRDYMLKLGYEPQVNSSKENSTSVTSRASAAVAGNGLNQHDMRALYRAFKFNKMPYVTFHELLLGLAAMDRSTAHGGHSGELRCSYIFRYYDFNSDGQLNSDELRAMAHDRLRLANVKQIHSAMRSMSNKQQNNAQPQVQHSASKSTSSSARSLAGTQKIDTDTINKELARIYQMLNLKMGESITEMNFMLAVGSMQLRGTSSLFRSQISILPVKQHYETIAEKHALTDIEGNLVGSELQRKGTCPRCKDKHYVLALHTVKLTHDAQIVEPTEVRFDEYPAPISRSQRQLSRAIFASDSTPNKLIDMITNYWNSIAAAQASGQHSTSSVSLRMLVGAANAVPLGKTTWERIDRQTLAEDIRRVCAQADQMFKREARVVAVTSPCIVLGDIHGNLNDLRTYERILWPNAPTCVSGSYLFLGDYVDRGEYGLECICYLLSMKVLAPKTFFLLRGNHELRSIQQAFTFFREVCEKFRNQQLGVQVWETLNKTFDLMPVAATIDDQIYCAHGGIPTSAMRLDELHNIPSPLPDPENQSAAAWEILWNDPVSSTEYSEYADLLRKQPGGQQAVANMQGYLPNTKRGTAFFFSEEAVKRFLHMNSLSHIIRAHECVPPGYALHCNGKVITIFSSSHYCGATNDAACILVEREKLRIIRLDTD